MSRAVQITAIGFFLLGAGVFGYKHFALEMPLRPDPRARVWRVELTVPVKARAARAQIELVVPRSDDTQIILDEQSFDDGLEFRRRSTAQERVARWEGEVADDRLLTYAFRVHLPEGANERGRVGLGPAPMPADAEVAEKPKSRPTRLAPELRDAIDELALLEEDDPAAIVARAFGFVAHEVETVAGASDDARLALAQREASTTGKSRLLVELLRGAGVEARLASGVLLEADGAVEPAFYAEFRTPRGWMPLWPDGGSPGDFPEFFVSLGRGDRPLLRTAGVSAGPLEVMVRREHLQLSELTAVLAPESPVWRALSLYRLPIETQALLEVLLVLPLAVLIAAIFRNLVGLRTFGTFLPILIALSLRRTELVSGLVLVTSVTCAGVLGRLLLDRLRLLFVPRICLLFCLVVLLVTGLAQVGHLFGNRSLLSGLLFPIVILSMLIERISVTTLEEGLHETQKLLGGSLLLAALAYPVFQSERLTHLFFGFPELVLCVMAGLVLIGGYTGYRAAELWRFRSMLREPEAGTP